MERYRIAEGASVYFVTFSVVEWLPVFVSGAACQIVADSFNFCHKNKGLRINAYVIMPTHLHAILFDREYNLERLKQAITDFRKFTGRTLSDFAAKHFGSWFSETLRASATADRERRFWQPSRHPEGIENEPFWQQKLDYLHDNPRRKGLVVQPEHWRYSSAAYYFSGGRQASEVTITPLEW